MAKKYEDFDEEDSDGLFGQILNIVSNRKREFAIASVAVALILLGVVIFGSYPDDEDAAGGSVPIVRADAGMYKTTPENPGGMEIPYRDSTVFSSADGARNDGGLENILADDTTEEPLPRDELFAGLNTENPQTPTGLAVQPILDDAPSAESLTKVESVEPPSNETLVKEAIGAAPAPAIEKPAPVVAKAEPAPVPAPAPKKEAVEAAKTEPAAGTTAAKVTAGTWYVQLASVRDASGAAGEFKKMQTKYGNLGGIDYRTQRADLASGTFYRIQAGPMSKDSATSVCNGIKAKGGSCLVVAK